MKAVEKILVLLTFYCASIMVNALLYVVLGETVSGIIFGLSIVGAVGLAVMRIGKKLTS